MIFQLVLTLFLFVTPGENMPERGICAHRGAMDTYPENTLAAFREAVRLGVQMIEWDVRMTRDGGLVIMHDPTVDRTTDGHGAVSEKTLAEIKQLDAGSWKSAAFKGERVPTLEEALEIIPDNIWLNVHIKGKSRELGRAVAGVIVKDHRLHQAFLTCREETAAGARQVQGNIMICNSERPAPGSDIDYAELSIRLKSNFVQFVRTDLGKNMPAMISKLKAHRIRINFYSSDDPVEMKQLFDSGIDFILVNHCAEALRVTDRMGIKRTNE